MRAIAFYLFGALAVFSGIYALRCWVGLIRLYNTLERNWTRQWAMPSPRTVFLSYRHKAKEQADAVRDEVVGAGLLVQMSNPEQLYKEPVLDIAKRIEGSVALILVQSEGSSDWIVAERNFAELNGLPVFEIQDATQVQGLINSILDSKREDIQQPEPDGRLDNLAKAFLKVSPTGKLSSDPYSLGADQHHFHTTCACFTWVVTLIFVVFVMLSWLVKPS